MGAGPTMTIEPITLAEGSAGARPVYYSNFTQDETPRAEEET